MKISDSESRVVSLSPLQGLRLRSSMQDLSLRFWTVLELGEGAFAVKLSSLRRFINVGACGKKESQNASGVKQGGGPSPKRS